MRVGMRQVLGPGHVCWQGTMTASHNHCRSREPSQNWLVVTSHSTDPSGGNLPMPWDTHGTHNICPNSWAQKTEYSGCVTSSLKEQVIAIQNRNSYALLLVRKQKITIAMKMVSATTRCW